MSSAVVAHGQESPFPETEAVREEAAVRSVWSRPVAWVLLVPMTFLLTGAQMLQPNDPEAFLDSSTAVLSTAAPTGRGNQFLAWLILFGVMAPCRQGIVTFLKRFPIFPALMLFVLASCVWADNPVETFRRGTLLDCTLLFGIYLSIRFDREEQLSLILGIGIAAVLASYLTAFLAPGLNRGFQGEWKGIYGHKNDLGMFTFFSLSPMFFMRRTTFRVRLFRGVVLLAALILEALSESRGGWVLGAVLFVYVGASYLLAQFERHNALLLIFAGVPLAATAGWVLARFASELAYALGKDPNLSNRTIIWAAVWPAILEKPLLGYGYGGFWNGLNGESAAVILRVGMGLVHAHNGVLTLWLQLGLVGVLITLALTLRGFWDFCAVLGTQRERHYFWYCAILFLTVVGSIDESFFFRQNLLTTALWVLACVELHKLFLTNKGEMV